MERGRRTKVIAIIALVVAVVGMSLGFAAFSNILTISSSATVTPSEDDFKMVAYGIGEDVVYDELGSSGSYPPIDSSLYSSLTSSKPFVGGSSGNNVLPSASSAIIDNETGKVTNLAAVFTEPFQIVAYYFIIKNEGKYDAYINFSDYAMFAGGHLEKKCIVGDETTETLAEAVCSEIYAHPYLYHPNDNNTTIMTNITDSYKIIPGDYVRFALEINYYGYSRVDGPLTIKFADFNGIYTTAPKGNVVNE